MIRSLLLTFIVFQTLTAFGQRVAKKPILALNSIDWPACNPIFVDSSRRGGALDLKPSIIFTYKGHDSTFSPITGKVVGIINTETDSVSIVAIQVDDYYLLFDGIGRTTLRKGQHVSKGQMLGVASGSYPEADFYAVTVTMQRGNTSIDPAPYFKAKCLR